MNVLSLFDGIRCGRVALEKANIKVDKYYSSEIDKYAIQIADKNYPQDIENKLGDVTKWREWNIDWSSIDLLIGGSPCQGFSIAGKKLNFEDTRSKLFFEYVDILNHIKEVNPKVLFLLENVDMKKEWQNIINEFLHEEPININSSLLSAQLRPRLYWTNIPNVIQPKDKKILLKDILLSEYDAKYILSDEMKNKLVERNQANVYMSLKTYNKAYRVMYNDRKSVCLDTAGGGGRTPYVIQNNQIRKLTPLECERLQTLPNRYTEGISDSQRYKCIGNGWTVDIIAHILSGIEERRL
jgi:DNA (cytosine-5)-methyltransferase 3A